MSTPSRVDRHAAGLARARKLRWLVVTGVVLGLAAGVSLALFAEERPIRVIGVVVGALNIASLVALRVVVRAHGRGGR